MTQEEESRKARNFPPHPYQKDFVLIKSDFADNVQKRGVTRGPLGRGANRPAASSDPAHEPQEFTRQRECVLGDPTPALIPSGGKSFCYGTDTPDPFPCKGHRVAVQPHEQLTYLLVSRVSVTLLSNTGPASLCGAVRLC